MLAGSDVRKAAIVLASLDVETAISICRHMPELQAEQLITTMGKLDRVRPDEQQKALEQFQEHLDRPAALRAPEYAERLMAEVLGREALSEEEERRRAALQRLRDLSKMEAASIRRMLAAETPQMVAVVISQLAPQKAAEVLDQWPPEMRSELVLRVARMERLAPGAIEAIGEVLGRRSYHSDDDGSGDSGLDFIVHLLEDMDRGASKRLLAQIRERDEELAEMVEDRLFTFENVVQLGDQDLQVLLRGIEHETIARALKGVDEATHERIFANVSERAREILEQELEFLGPVLVRDVEAAQRAFVNHALQLEQDGEITLTTEEEQYIE